MKQLILAVLLLAILSMGLFAQDATTAKATASAAGKGEMSKEREITNRQIFRDLLGKWTGTMNLPEIGKVTQHLEFTLAKTGTHLNMTLEVLDDGVLMASGSGWLKVDETSGRVQIQIAMNSEGMTFSAEETSNEGEVIRFEGGTDKHIPHFKSSIEFVNALKEGKIDKLKIRFYAPESPSSSEWIAFTIFTR